MSVSAVASQRWRWFEVFQLYGVLGHSLKTTNCIESVNAAYRGTLHEGRSTLRTSVF